MNEEQKKSAIKAKAMSITIMSHLGKHNFSPSEKLSTIMNLLCMHILRNIKPSEVKNFLKWAMASIPIIIKNKNAGLGLVSGHGDDVNIEITDDGKEPKTR